MLSFRNLNERDCDFILEQWVGNSAIFKERSKDELIQKIKSMNTKKYHGNYYEMFGILNDNVLVGTFSFYQREIDKSENAVYLGVEISASNRKKGFATKAIMMAFEFARGKGYEKIFSQASVYNDASVNLHKKCGFEVIEKTINSKGNEVYNYRYVL